jgi:anthranilate synthase/aminodeoxychorismate synthase-like glutamine amidotransferase
VSQRRPGPHVLLVDNYDSFTYNLAHLFGELGACVDVVRNDAERLTAAFVRSYDGVVIGPGPGRPEGAGSSLRAIAWAADAGRPTFGVCLGQQAIAEHFGGRTVHAPHLMHGKTSEITHDATGVFAAVPSPFAATRYHSLCVDAESLSPELRVTARSADGVIQGLAHRTLPVHAVQFHPESVLTVEGRRIFANFLAMTRT